jgi:hypothetical protein
MRGFLIAKGQVKCAFQYSCVGGSSEEWEIVLTQDEGGTTCTIER